MRIGQNHIVFLSNTYFTIKIIYRYNNDRMLLQMSDNQTCQLTIKEIQFKDDGEWHFSIHNQLNKTIKANIHNISVHQNGL